MKHAQAFRWPAAAVLIVPVLLAAVLIVPVLLAACALPQAAAPTGAPSPTAPPLANEAIRTVTEVSSPTRYRAPFDAALSPDGAQVYFTAEADAGDGVFRAVPGGDAEPLAQGAPLVEPRGLALSSDGSTIYIADQAAPDSAGVGQVFSLPIAGGAPAALPGAAGYRPRALAVVGEGGADVLYIVGSRPDDGRPVLLRVSVGSDSATIVASGSPMVEPSGVTVAGDGTILVADRGAAGEGRGSLFRVRGSSVERIASGFLVGGPVVGVALTFDEQAVLVSSLEEQTRSAQALIVDLKSLGQARFNNVIGANSGAGGLQRAADRNIFVWADSLPPRPIRPRPAGEGSSVYTLEP